MGTKLLKIWSYLQKNRVNKLMKLVLIKLDFFNFWEFNLMEIETGSPKNIF